MIFAIGPVINIANPWYVYYPLVIMSFGVLYCLIYSALPIKRGCFALVLFINISVTAYTAYQTYEVGILNKKILAEVNKIDCSNLRLVNVPVTISNNLLTLPFASFVSFGMKAIYNKEVTVQYGARRVIHSVPKNVTFIPVEKTTLSLKAGNKSHFALNGEPLEERMSYEVLQRNWLGKPVALNLSFHDTTKTYLFKELTNGD